MRHEIAYGVIAVLVLLTAFGLWKLRKPPARKSRHIRVDLTGKSKP